MHMCDMTHARVWQGASIRITWYTCMCYDTDVCATGRMPVWHMSHAHVCRGLCTCVSHVAFLTCIYGSFDMHIWLFWHEYMALLTCIYGHFSGRFDMSHTNVHNISFYVTHECTSRIRWLMYVCGRLLLTVTHACVRHDCNTLQHTATHWNTLQHNATHCITLQYTVTHCNMCDVSYVHVRQTHVGWVNGQWNITHILPWLQYTVTHCTTMQHTALQCNTLQHIATHCNRISFASFCTHQISRHACDMTHTLSDMTHTLSDITRASVWYGVHTSAYIYIYIYV